MGRFSKEGTQEMKRLVRSGIAAAAAAALALSMAGCSSGNTEKAASFDPSLDTNATVQLDAIGYFGNFEALDQVVADFNEYYPNVTFNYQQVGGSDEEAYLDANPGTDVIMTSHQTLKAKGFNLVDYCDDLSQDNIDTSAIDEKMLANSYVDGTLVSIPMGQNIAGIVVNTSLLEKEGLEVPKTKSEFLDCCKALKEKGYTPVQGPSKSIYADLTVNEMASIIGKDSSLASGLASGDKPSIAKMETELEPALDFIKELVDKGYTDPKVNDSYPEDNYDGAIMTFFEGEVPFWVCNTEKVSGMKKRESKSDAFTANPFSYTFIGVPNGDEYGQYAYQEPWFGFGVCKTSDNKDYAAEFVRFLATKDEINTMSSVKGVPSVAVEPTNAEIYQNVLASEMTQNAYINDGTITPDMSASWYTVANEFATGKYKTAGSALETFAKSCKQ